MRFGRDATVAHVIREISKIMTLTGATGTAEKAKSSASIADAVDIAVMWFKGKVCLYLVDDLWPAKHLPDGYFQDLCQLVRGCERSRMAISTRSLSIAKKAGCPVKFETREPRGTRICRHFHGACLRGLDWTKFICRGRRAETQFVENS